jgi:hypothetical protein
MVNKPAPSFEGGKWDMAPAASAPGLFLCHVDRAAAAGGASFFTRPGGCLGAGYLPPKKGSF